MLKITRSLAILFFLICANAQAAPLDSARDAIKNRDYDGAIKIAQQEIKANDSAEAYNLLGGLYFLGMGVKPSRDLAVYNFTQAAERGNVNAQATLGSIYLNDATSDDSIAQAKKWLFPAAQKGSESALYNVGLIYEQGLTEVKDMDKAVDFFKRSANSGYALAKIKLGILYQSGVIQPDLEDEPLRLFREAAQQGSSEGAYLLGKSYAKGAGVTKDLDAAATWYLTAAQRGNPMAQANIASMYEQGIGVNKDPLTAFKWYWLARSKIPAVLPRLDALRGRMSADELEHIERSKEGWAQEVSNGTSHLNVTVGNQPLKQ